MRVTEEERQRNERASSVIQVENAKKRNIFTCPYRGEPE